MCLNKTPDWARCLYAYSSGILWYSLVFSSILWYSSGILWYSLCFLFCKLKGKWQFEKLNYILYINKKMILYI